MNKERPMQMWMVVVLAAAVMMAPSLALAQAAEAAEGDEPKAAAGKTFAESLDEFIKQSKDPAPWLNWGADARLRVVFTPNLLLDREDSHWQRYRFRAWATIKPIKDFALNTRLVWEPRHYCQPSRKFVVRDATLIDEWTRNEAIFDRMNVQWSNVLGMPLTLKVGRQDIILGDGWLVLDGTPMDDSRTIFFDAARATLDLKDMKTTVDLIFICQNADSDYWLPPICDKDFHNIEQDELGIILYASNKSLAKTQIDGYLIFKHDRRELTGVDAGVAPWTQGADAEIYTLGGRVAGDIDEHWKYRAELAGQFGRKNGRDLNALGFNSRVSYFRKDKLNNNFRVGYEYLSGDKESTTGTDEQFDPLWGRWGRFSELLAYTVSLENRLGETTNLHRVGLGWSCNPTKKLEVCADYNLLFADKNSYRTIPGDKSTPRRPFFSKSGCFRGQLLGLLLKHELTPHVKHHVLAELFAPGDFYDDLNDEFAAFLRYEIMFTW